jgi:hypothetical protein
MADLLAILQARWGSKGRKPLAVFVLYEDGETDSRARDFCTGISGHITPTRDFVQRAWLFNELRMPRMRQVAAEEAAQSDLIIVSIHGADRIPTEVTAWAELLSTQKVKRSSLVIGLLDTVYQGDLAILTDFLKNLAKRIHAKFIYRFEELPNSNYSFR